MGNILRNANLLKSIWQYKGYWELTLITVILFDVILFDEIIWQPQLHDVTEEKLYLLMKMNCYQDYQGFKNQGVFNTQSTPRIQI